MGLIKEKVLEKWGAASLPKDALENARHFLESVVKDASVAAHGLTKDALNRIKNHLVDILPNSLSPSLATKMVDDAEKEVNEEAAAGKVESGEGGDDEQGKGPNGNEQEEDNKNRSIRSNNSPPTSSSVFANSLKPPSSRL